LADPAEQQDETPGTPPRRRARRSILVGIAVIFAVVVYAYGFEVTEVSLDELGSETRQQQLINVLRDLARPELLTYERVETDTDADFYMPCPAGEFAPGPFETDGRTITVSPPCVEPGGEITVAGSGFAANARGTLYLVAPDGGLELKLDEFQTDTTGNFETTIDTRERAEEAVQTIRAKTRENIGTIFNRVEVATGDVDNAGQPVTVMSPRISRAASDTWTRIIETVFLAFIATTLGVLLAVPLSFLAARNLMRDISTPMIKLSLQILALPLGIVVGAIAAGWARTLSESITVSTVLVVAGVIVLPLLIVYAVRWAIPPQELTKPTPTERAVRIVVLAASGIAAIVLLYLIASLLGTFGDWVAPKLGTWFDFLGAFLSKLGQVLAAIITLVTALATAGLFMNLAGRLGSLLRRRMNPSLRKGLNIPLAALAGGVTAILIAQGIGWLYRITDPVKTIWVPLAVGAAFGITLALRALHKESIKIGLSVYYIARTIFNGIRSIEPLIMVIVFVVWVGLGPFAGSLALALHTIAALAKLYSEQVESVMTGPMEAVKATGATRMQTIVYAVIPQIVPPYISFTMYRWDINVRMSTIIGFGGGGGIGFLLQQNIRLLNYRAAAVNMLAIAIVVASMDYLSGRVRERLV